MLIKINTTESLDRQIDGLKNHWDVGTASKACSLASIHYLGVYSEVEKLTKENVRLTGVIHELLEAFESKRIADEQISKLSGLLL